MLIVVRSFIHPNHMLKWWPNYLNDLNVPNDPSYPNDPNDPNDQNDLSDPNDPNDPNDPEWPEWPKWPEWQEASKTIDRMVYFSCYIQIMKTINQWYPQNFQCYKLNRWSNECAVNCSVLVTNFVINKLNCCFVLLAAGFLILNHKNIILGDINKLKVSHSDSFYFRSYEFDSSKYSNFIHNLNIF